MIGFNLLGRLGRLGNQMFQYSALKGIAYNNNYDFCIPNSNGSDIWKDHQLFKCFNLDVNIGFINSEKSIKENKFSFDSNLFNNCPDNVSLFGYFQTEKYFLHIKDEIKKDFIFKSSILDSCKDAIKSVENPISLHIRRTDYLTDSNHTTLPLEYYEQAIKKFDKTRNILIFSDDTEWCKNQKLFESDRFMVSEGQDTFHDLCLMTLCSDHIIANSSFSWWGAWLAKDNTVIAPSGWFSGSNNKHLDTADLIPNGWEVL